MKDKKQHPPKPKGPGIFSLLTPYEGPIWFLSILAVLSSAIGLIFPKIISHAIDTFIRHEFVLNTLLWEFGLVIFSVFVITYAQNIVQTYTSERVARDLRQQLADKISLQSYAFIENVTPGKLLTNLTSDIDAIKMFVGQAIATLISSVIIVIGAAILLIMINWGLAIVVLLIIPIIGILFSLIFSRVRVLMMRSREVIDWLNKVINESILGSALIRVLNSQQPEYEKFLAANTDAKHLGVQILKQFASMIPIVTFVGNLAMLTILLLGGHFVIIGGMSIGDFTAFNSYIALLVFPLLMIGFMGSSIAQATAAYQRIVSIRDAKDVSNGGECTDELRGDVAFSNVTLMYGEKHALKDISFSVKAQSKTAIIGPTTAGKTQLLYLLIGLVEATSGKVMYDGKPISEYNKESLHEQIGFVFQDSSIFNLSLRENIAFSDTVKDADLQKAIETSELTDFVATLPEGLDTMVAERGTSLSGGQKQRIMLARALAVNPKVLLLDDFTARVDTKTEKKILDNIMKNYPDTTLISVTQKIGAVEKYDQIIVLMEGELIATGTHDHLISTSPEYVQIYNSQKSTSHYE